MEVNSSTNLYNRKPSFMLSRFVCVLLTTVPELYNDSCLDLVGITDQKKLSSESQQSVSRKLKKDCTQEEVLIVKHGDS